MKGLSRVFVIGPAGAILICSLGSLRAGQRTRSCAGAEIEAFRNQALPLWAGNITSKTEWRACARGIDPWNPEIRVCVTKFYDGDVSADFAQARGTKLSEQFCSLNLRIVNPCLSHS